ncbi:response regulator [Paraliomyxa miuraensis]|uniref:response regulator n=1 Tax=Paraliomyxa miuraensis TaxID=376150 RepID=UPI002257E7DF|nr:response regulator [Paraliomyxa miuraensis]MCX4247746.1 response regulator [Paraliomyxa miuraensis]
MAEQDLEALRFVNRVLPVPVVLLSALVTFLSDRPWVTGGLVVVFVGVNAGLGQVAMRRGRALRPRTNELRHVFDVVVLLLMGMTAGPRAPVILMAIPPICGAPFLLRGWRVWVAITVVTGAAFIGSLLAGAAFLDIAPVFMAEIGLAAVLVAAVVELRRREAEREEALEQANRAARAKSEFLSLMSHEVRTPLHGMMSTISLLEDRDLDAVSRSKIATVATCGRDMLRVLTDVLAMSQMQSGDMDLPEQDLVVTELTKEVIERARTMVGARDVVLTTELDPRLAHRYRGPTQAIGQVLDRLLHNAISFTPTGSVTVGVTQRSDSLCFVVRDTGSGIPQSAISGIFATFTQADTTTTRSHGGMGLGLAISRRIVEHLGGRIEVHSEEGVGSTFSFTVPCQVIESEGPAHATDEGKASAPRLTPDDLVLVVDDNEINRRVMVSMLRKLGYRADTVNDGQEAVEHTRTNMYPLILMDCFMPVMDGYEATRLIRQRDGHRSRIIGITADALADARTRCLDAGMDDYVAKPIPLPALRALLGDASGQP